MSSVAVSEDLHEELTSRSGEGGRMLELIEFFETGDYKGTDDSSVLDMGRYHQSAVLWSEEMVYI